MKVLHIVSAPAAGGAEVLVRDMAIGSESEGVSAAVLFVSRAEDIGRSESFERQFLAELQSNGVPFYFLPTGSRRNLLKGIRAFRAVVKAFSPDIIHSHLLSGILYGAIGQKATPLVYTHHNSVVKVPAVLFRVLMSLCQHIISISPTCEARVNEVARVGAKSTVIYNAVDSSRFSRRKPNSLGSKADINILSVGGLIEQKNYSLLVAAARRVVDAGVSNFCVKIAGEGVLRETLTNEIRANGLEGRISLLGNRSDVPELFSVSDIFVMSSAWEGLPIALIEAQISGVPSIVTDVGGCKEVIEMTGGGVVVPAFDVEALAQAIRSLVTSAPKRKTLAEKSLSGENVFSIRRALTEHRELYHRLASA